MSIGRLLLAGKSLVGGQNGSSRYRLDKRARLPKFGSPKNPFVKEKRTPPRPDAVQQTAAGVRPATQAAAPAVNEVKPVTTQLRQAVLRLREWCADMNPIPRLAKPVRSAPSPRYATSPVQSELSLDEVKVVRNDLSDADLEIVPAKPVRRAEAEPMPEENAWSRLTTRIFVRTEHD